MTDHPQYWFARRGDKLLTRHSYAIVHWKGFVALFAAIMGSIWLLILGMVSTIFVIAGEIPIENVILKIGAVIIGVCAVIASVIIPFYAYGAMKKRTDPVNDAAYYRKKFFQKLSGK